MTTTILQVTLGDIAEILISIIMGTDETMRLKAAFHTLFLFMERVMLLLCQT